MNLSDFPKPSPLPLTEWAVFAILAEKRCRQAISAGTVRFTEQRSWTAVERDFSSLDSSKSMVPVLLGNSSDGSGVVAWGTLRSLAIRGTQTEVEVENVQKLPWEPRKSALTLLSSGKGISENDIWSYRIVQTPAFLTNPPRIVEQPDPKLFVLLWNPDAAKYDVEAFSDWGYWTCRAKRKVRAGDRFLMLKQGTKPRGVVASGYFTTEVGEAVEFGQDDGERRAGIRLDCEVPSHRPLDPSTIPGAEVLSRPKRTTGTQIPPEEAKIVLAAWQRHCDAEGAEMPDVEPVASVEGRMRTTLSSRRERLKCNRDACLASLPAAQQEAPPCAVCGMNFLARYGEIGRGFIHVHHTRPAASLATEGEMVVPSEELVTVCPNCHAMLHIGLHAGKGQVRSVAELRELMQAVAAG